MPVPQGYITLFGEQVKLLPIDELPPTRFPAIAAFERALEVADLLPEHAPYARYSLERNKARIHRRTSFGECTRIEIPRRRVAACVIAVSDQLEALEERFVRSHEYGHALHAFYGSSVRDRLRSKGIRTPETVNNEEIADVLACWELLSEDVSLDEVADLVRRFSTNSRILDDFN